MPKRKREKTKKRKKGTCPLQKPVGVAADPFLPFPEELLEEYEGVEWICSHLFPDKILWSSDTSKIQPNIDSSLFSCNNVVNTWFVQSPIAAGNFEEKNFEENFRKAADLIDEASSILIVAGAGMGVDSGLPDYRSPKGFWKAYPLLKSRGISLEEMSHPDWFATDPHSAWGFYGHRAELYHAAIPHQGYQILKELVNLKKDNYFIFTSNIDSQFQKAGFDTDKIYECHGSLSYLQCMNDECDEVWEASVGEIPKISENLKAISALPVCPSCKSIARPNVSMFGDTNITWKELRATRQKHSFLKWLREVHPQFFLEKKGRKLRKKKKGSKLVILEIGCGISLHSLRMEVQLLIEESKKREDLNLSCVRINPTDCTINEGDKFVGIQLGAFDSLVNIGNLLGVKIKDKKQKKKNKSVSENEEKAEIDVGNTKEEFIKKKEEIKPKNLIEDLYCDIDLDKDIDVENESNSENQKLFDHTKHNFVLIEENQNIFSNLQTETKNSLNKAQFDDFIKPDIPQSFLERENFGTSIKKQNNLYPLYKNQNSLISNISHLQFLPIEKHDFMSTPNHIQSFNQSPMRSQSLSLSNLSYQTEFQYPDQCQNQYHQNCQNYQNEFQIQNHSESTKLF